MNMTRTLQKLFVCAHDSSAPTIRLSHDDILARHQKHLIIIIIMKMRTYSFKHSDNVLSVVEGSDLIVTSAVDDGHRLQTHAFHCNLWCQQEPVIEVVEKLVPVVKQSIVSSFATNNNNNNNNNIICIAS